MNRNAFTWIELIFVIIVVGILSAVALIKLAGIADRAEEVKLKAFTGTLNRTSGAGFWFRSINEGRNGSVAFADYSVIVDQYIELIPNYTAGPSFESCNSTGTGVFLAYSFSEDYEIHCKDGSRSEGPYFRLYNASSGQYVP